MRYPGMVAAVVILVLLGLSAFVLTSPSGQQFLNMYSSGGLQLPGVATGQQYGQSSFGMPW